MALKVYTLYASAAAAANLANVQILRDCEVLGINFGLYAAVGNGAAAEVSTQSARQFQNNNPNGILAIAIHSVAAAATSVISSNQFVPFPPGCNLKTGDYVYLHGTQLGAGGTLTYSVNVLVREK